MPLTYGLPTARIEYGEYVPPPLDFSDLPSSFSRAMERVEMDAKQYARALYKTRARAFLGDPRQMDAIADGLSRIPPDRALAFIQARLRLVRLGIVSLDTADLANLRGAETALKIMRRRLRAGGLDYWF